MKMRVVIHRSCRAKYAAWRRQLPGKTDDRQMLLDNYYTTLASEAVRAMGRKPKTIAFWLEGPANSWFQVVVE